MGAYVILYNFSKNPDRKKALFFGKTTFKNSILFRNIRT